MKKLLLLLSGALFLISSCQTENTVPGYSVKGTIKNTDDVSVYLVRFKGKTPEYIDTAQLANGVFLMEGSLDVPENLYFKFGNEDHFLPVFMSNNKISITADLDSIAGAAIEGAPYQMQIEEYNKSFKLISDKKQEIYDGYKKAESERDQAGMDKYDALWDEMDGQEKALIITYVENHPKSPVSPYLVHRNTYFFDLSDLEDMDGTYDVSLNASPDLIYLRERIAGLKLVAIGNKYSDITMVDTLGNSISISDQDGKYRLVDFWASWCGPCRRENPNIVNLYEKYKDDNFTVIGISFDENGEKWKKAIVDDKLNWAQMSDLKGWGSAAGKVYIINSIPSNVLIDPAGIIIAKNLRGEDLQAKLSELFD